MVVFKRDTCPIFLLIIRVDNRGKKWFKIALIAEKAISLIITKFFIFSDIFKVETLCHFYI